MPTPLTPDDPPELGGHRLAGRLGEGGQGVVYLAHSEAGEPVAIKLLSTGDRETRARLARELEALESIASFCTARVLAASTRGPRPYVISEYIAGPSLAGRVHERGPLAGGELERVVVGTATALAAIHAAGVVHRDFKPANVLLGPDGPRVVDFGIARAEGAATMTSGLVGTPAYVTPEQIAGAPASAASDVFAWAATMVFAATGVSPFGADTVPAVLHRVLHTDPDLTPLPPRLRTVIAACLAKDPAARPTARDLMIHLVNPNTPPPSGPAGGPPPGGSAGDSSSGGRPYGAGRRTGPLGAAVATRPVRRRGAGVLVGAVAVVLALGAGGGALLWLNGTPSAQRPGTTVSPSATGPATTASPSSSATTADPGAGITDLLPELSVGTGRPTDTIEVPAEFAGTWKGTVDGEAGGKRFENESVTLVLREGEPTGVWDSPGDAESDPGCGKGTLYATELKDSTLHFTLSDLGGLCAYLGGTGSVKVTLELKDDGRADYNLTMPMGTSEGELTKSA